MAPAPVSLVTIHHEGAGAPSNDPRGAAGGYTYWIGVDHFARLRTPWDSFATLGFNHVSLDVCLSGDRMHYPVTGIDTELIRRAVAEARQLGYVVDAPLVRAHRNSPGSSTVCPGDYTMAKWGQVVAACTKPAGGDPAPTPKAPTMPAIVASPKGGYWQVKADGSVFAFGGAKPLRGVNGQLPAGRTIVSVSCTPTGAGLYLTQDNGDVNALGDAHYAGSVNDLP